MYIRYVAAKSRPKVQEGEVKQEDDITVCCLIFSGEDEHHE
jgi:hypothetical protein